MSGLGGGWRREGEGGGELTSLRKLADGRVVVDNGSGRAEQEGLGVGGGSGLVGSRVRVCGGGEGVLLQGLVGLVCYLGRVGRALRVSLPLLWWATANGSSSLKGLTLR